MTSSFLADSAMAALRIRLTGIGTGLIALVLGVFAKFVFDVLARLPRRNNEQKQAGGPNAYNEDAVAAELVDGESQQRADGKHEVNHDNLEDLFGARIHGGLIKLLGFIQWEGNRFALPRAEPSGMPTRGLAINGGNALKLFADSIAAIRDFRFQFITVKK